jgi:hypothetical protein
MAFAGVDYPFSDEHEPFSPRPPRAEKERINVSSKMRRARKSRNRKHILS